MKLSRLVLHVCLIFLLFMMTACGNIKQKKSSDDYIGSNYEVTVEELKKLGFSNIVPTEIADLTSADLKKDGYIESISINGESAFDKNSTFPKDAEVVLVYHVIKKISFPIEPNEVNEMDYVDIGDLLTRSGYTNVVLNEIYDLDPDKDSNASYNEIVINGSSTFTKSDKIPFDAQIEVNCHLPYEKYTLNMDVHFVGNIIFDKYDVDFMVDDEIITTIPHGKDWTSEVRIQSGSHMMRFVKSGDTSIKGEVELDIASDIDARYIISCYSDYVSVKNDYFDRKIELDEGQVKIPCTESNYKHKNYQDIITELKELGFTNIIENPLYDIIWGWTDVGETDSVTINGTNEYKRGDIFNSDDEVIITYHMNYDDDPVRIAEAKEKEEKKAAEAKEREEREALEAKELEEREAAEQQAREEQMAEEASIREAVTDHTYTYARDYMNDLGYTTKYEHDYTHMDFTGSLDFEADEDLDDLGWIVTGVKEINVENKTATLYVNTTENIARIEAKEKMQRDLENNFDPAVAMAALETYGKKQYPYGFSLHMMTGKIAETAVDENTWFMKYYATIKNEYGNKRNVICEGKIEGPESNPTVYDFYVYDD